MGFDGFGNLLSKTPTGGAPTLSQAVSTTTNRIVGADLRREWEPDVELVGDAGVRRGESREWACEREHAVSVRFAEQAGVEGDVIGQRDDAGAVFLRCRWAEAGERML